MSGRTSEYRRQNLQPAVKTGGHCRAADAADVPFGAKVAVYRKIPLWYNTSNLRGPIHTNG